VITSAFALLKLGLICHLSCHADGLRLSGQDLVHVTPRIFGWHHPTAASDQFVMRTDPNRNPLRNRNKARVDLSIDLSEFLPARILILQSSHLSAYKHRVALAILHVWLTGD
jgi:hypothetical protein